MDSTDSFERQYLTQIKVRQLGRKLAHSRSVEPHLKLFLKVCSGKPIKEQPNPKGYSFFYSNPFHNKPSDSQLCDLRALNYLLPYRLLINAIHNLSSKFKQTGAIRIYLLF